MAKTNNLTDFLTDVADAIREKEGSAETINPQNFSSRVRAIAGLEEKEQVVYTELDSFLLDIADTIREAEGSTESINPQSFSNRIRGLEVDSGEIDEDTAPLFIEAINDITISFSNDYQYSKNGKRWTNATSETSISANSGGKIYFRASGLTASSSAGIGSFTISDNCNLGGNILSLIYGDAYEDNNALKLSYAFFGLFKNQPIINAERLKLPTTISESCFCEMFYGCSSLVSAPSLPATSLKISCYQKMFYDCSSLVSAPSLPAKSLQNFCYANMFTRCSSLVSAPSLPATSLRSGCYSAMFSLCVNLNYIEAMFTTTPNSSYTYSWVNKVASSGTFVKNKSAKWDVTGADGVPEGWTIQTK